MTSSHCTVGIPAGPQPEAGLPGAIANVDEVVKQAVGAKLFVDHKVMNVVGKALGYDHQLIYVLSDGYQVHIAEKVACDNLRSASEQRIRKEIATQERQMHRQGVRRLERIAKGRTPGAGAGGFNRDLSCIEHRIDDARVKIDLLHGELVRRRGRVSEAA